MAYRRRAIRKRSYAKRSRSSSSRFKSRRSYGTRSRSSGSGLFRRKFRRSTHKRLSRQTVKSLFPDIAKSKAIGHHIWTNIPCNDLADNLAFGQGTTTSNTLTIRMNANPNGGAFYTQPLTDIPATDILNPVSTYITRYTKYRPMGCKVVLTIFSQDNGETEQTQVANPFMLYGFPFTTPSGNPGISDYANDWSGVTTTGYNGNTIPQMKYGFKRISPGMGGKNMVKYSTYWDFAKILGVTKEQYLSSQLFTCAPDDNGNSPLCGVFLCLALADYTTTLDRQCTVDIKITQYGRWEGQRIRFE